MSAKLFGAAVALLFLAAPPAFSDNVVWILLDGVRRQEWLEGVDATILAARHKAGIENPDALHDLYWRETPEARRRALMPFFWTVLAPRGVVLRSTITNPHRTSYPGYAELLTGRAVPEIEGNYSVQIPWETSLEIARRSLGLEVRDVAAVTSWNHFRFIAAHQPGAVFVDYGEAVPAELATPEMARWRELQTKMLTPWDSIRHNAITVQLALEYLKTYQPRLLLLALSETDEWAHDRRYDRTVQSLRGVDDSLREIWTTLQSIEVYRGRTSLVLSTDHGRGLTLEDWTSHGSTVPGSEQAWIAVVGPHTPDVGSMPGIVRNDQVAATVLTLLGIDYRVLGPETGPPIRAAIR